MLAFHIADILQIPFGYLLSWLYQFTTSYGMALILFTVIVKLILLPTTAKSKKSMMKMSRVTPKLQALQAKFANDPQKLNEATMALYKQEGVSMGGGCVWSLIPMLILIPLYTVVREPITYMLHESTEVIEKVLEIVKAGAADSFTNNYYYDQMVAAPLLPNFAEQLKGVVANPATLEGINFTFLGVDLAAVPSFNIFGWEKYDWAHIGAFLIPVLSAGSQVLSMMIMQKMNNSVVTNDKGVQDEAAVKQSQMNKTNKIMMWMMPLMSLWIGFTVPAALGIYWLFQGLISTVVDVILTNRYRKIYDAEDAANMKKAMEEEAIEAEKERLRAERRAANPDGITENTSKKKLQQKQQREAEAAKAAALKEYNAKKGIVEEEPKKKSTETMSGIQSRPFCKGRNYNPNRYGSHNTEE